MYIYLFVPQSKKKKQKNFEVFIIGKRRKLKLYLDPFITGFGGNNEKKLSGGMIKRKKKKRKMNIMFDITTKKLKLDLIIPTSKKRIKCIILNVLIIVGEELDQKIYYFNSIFIYIVRCGDMSSGLLSRRSNSLYSMDSTANTVTIFIVYSIQLIITESKSTQKKSQMITAVPSNSIDQKFFREQKCIKTTQDQIIRLEYYQGNTGVMERPAVELACNTYSVGDNVLAESEVFNVLSLAEDDIGTVYEPYGPIRYSAAQIVWSSNCADTNNQISNIANHLLIQFTIYSCCRRQSVSQITTEDHRSDAPYLIVYVVFILFSAVVYVLLKKNVNMDLFIVQKWGKKKKKQKCQSIVPLIYMGHVKKITSGNESFKKCKFVDRRK
ncbi:hypothetical protein RFI_39928 [Reticulomyxa filosa]|uniref:Uncharacterized protein n=1 Tax=Reticulomyxa filosa TaxID=46433 RepID=X6L813_RETFI|nr:hypothetical protein RFI_39928 [Reticulomyxa filosa]|eukprot:ETN97600.1 hypothetical protein RFI_39928 [Reticulomyxa filosa]